MSKMNQTRKESMDYNFAKSEKKRVLMKKSKEELELEKLVLGEGEDVIENLEKSERDEKLKQQRTKSKRKDGKKTKGKKRQAKDEKEFKDKRKKTDDSSSEDDDPKNRKPVWKDETDLTETHVRIPKRNQRGTLYYEKKETSYEELADELKNKFISVSGTPSWAQLDNKMENEDDIVKRVGNFIGKTNELSKDTVDMTICRNLASNLDQMGAVTSLEFHPKAQVVLVANSRQKVFLRQVDGVKNPIIQKVKMNGFPISCARFTTDGEHFFVSSYKYQHFFTYDMMTGNTSKVYSNRNVGKFNMEKFHLSPDGQLMVTSGKDGYMHVLSAKTKEFLYSSKMNSSLRGVAFSSDGTRIYSQSDEGEVYIWDVRQKECIHKFQDDGCIHGTSIALATSEQYLATGSDTGVVNIYDTSSLLSSSTPTPHKTFLNLTTAVTELKFNSTSEILALASSEKPAAFRLVKTSSLEVHCSSMTVFKNAPYRDWKLGSISCLDVSLNSGFLAVGTREGNANLIRLNHYGSY